MKAERWMVEGIEERKWWCPSDPRDFRIEFLQQLLDEAYEEGRKSRKKNKLA